jgi:hypothetical protein
MTTTNRMAQSDAPALPLQFSYNCELSDDYFATETIVVDVGESASPMAVFYNPLNQMTEAVIIANGTLMYLHYDPSQPTGWTFTPFVTAPGQGTVVVEVVALATPDGVPNVFYSDGSHLYQALLTGNGTWSVSPQSGHTSKKLRVTYNQHGNAPILYAEEDWQTLGYFEYTGGEWQYTSRSFGFSDDLNFDNGSMFLTVNDKYWYLTLMGDSGGFLTSNDPSLNTRVIPPAGQQVLAQALYTAEVGSGCGIVYWGTDNRIALAGAFELPWLPDPEFLPWLAYISTIQFQSLSAVVCDNNNLSAFFGIDVGGKLWALRQTGWSNLTTNTPWATFMAPVPLASGIAAAYCDVRPTDTLSVFAIDTDDNLWLYRQDSTTGLWMSRPVQSSSTNAYHASRYRTEVTLYDGNGNPLAGYPLTVAVGSATEIAVNNQYHLLDSTASATVTTDVQGKVTIATMADDLTPPLLTVTATGGDGQPVAVQINPAQLVQSYFAGTGSLPTAAAGPSGPGATTNTWNGTTLSSAAVDGQSIVPSNTFGPNLSADQVVSTIQQLANYPAVPNSAVSQAVGFTISRGDANGAGASLESYSSRAELHAALARHPVRHVRITNADAFGSHISKWWGDLCHGIKKAVVAVAHFTVEVTDALETVVTLVVDGIEGAIQFVIESIEDAFAAILAAFNALIQDIVNLIDWLKALFDFKAIMDTATALEQAFTALPIFLNDQLTNNASKYTNGFFTNLNAKLQTQLGQVIASYRGTNQSFAASAGPNWQPPGQPPSNTQTIGNTGVTPAGVVNNPHANWFMTNVSSGAPSIAVSDSVYDLSTIFSTFSQDIEAAAKAFTTALQSFAASDQLKSFFDSPKSFGDMLITDFLLAVGAVAEAVLAFLDALAESALTFAEGLLTGIGELFQVSVPMPFLSTIYGWIWDLAVNQGWNAPTDGPPAQMTVLQLMSILVAFPVTVLYKIMVDVNGEPFPGGVWTQPGGQNQALDMSGTQKLLMSSALAEILSSVPAAISDGLGSETPRFITLGGLAFWLAADVLVWPDLNQSSWLDISLWFASLTQVVVGFVAPMASAFKLEGVATMLDELMPVISSAAGLGEWILAALATLPGSTEDGLTIAASLLTPLPIVFSFATIPALQDLDPIGPLLIPLKIILDFVGYAGGGGLELVDVMS